MSLYQELKRRNVFRAAILYIVASWLILQIADVTVSLLTLPEWTGKLIYMLVALGFVPALIFSWLYELTPEGLKREHEVARQESITHQTARKIDVLIGVFGALVLVVIVLDRVIPDTAMVAPDGVRAGSIPEDKSIAVLPFVNMSAEAEQEYFSDGLSEELLDLLTKIPELRVISRTSSFQFKGQNEDIRVIAEKLGVATVLEGSVRKSGDQIRVTAQLIQAADGSHLWSQSYNRDLDNLFAVQADIAGAVVGALRVQLLDEAPAPRYTPSSEAHALYLQGRYWYQKFSRENLERAADYYEHAIELDPDYAAAWAWLAHVRASQADLYIDRDTGVALAREAIAEALRRDDAVAEAYIARGIIELLFGWDWAVAEAALQKALALDPGNAEALRWTSALHFNSGDIDEAIRLAELSLAHDPLNAAAHSWYGLCLDAAGRLSEAEAAFRKVLELAPGYAGAREHLARVYIAQQRAEEALTVIQQEDEIWRLTALPVIYHSLGRPTESEAALAELIAKHSDIAAVQIAMAYASRGETDAAFEWLERAYQQRDGGLSQMKSMPQFAGIRDDPRFVAMLEKLNLAD